jgi:AraC family transcriptional regulator
MSMRRDAMTVTVLETIRAHGLKRGVEVWPVFAGHSVHVDTWQCTTAAEGRTAELHQSWPAIGFVHAGACLLHRAGRESLLDAVTPLVIEPGLPHWMSRVGAESPHGSSISVHPDVAAALRRRSPASPPPCATAAYVVQRLLLRRLLAGLSDDPQAIESIALRIYARAHTASLSARPEPQWRRDYVSGAQALLAGRYLELPNLPELAASAGVSVFHFCRTFKVRTGLGVSRYVHRLRLRFSLDRVADPETNLSDLAVELGYSSHSHFAKAFRSEFAISPTELRRIASSASLRELATRMGV